MDNLPIKEETLAVDSSELLLRFIHECTNTKNKIENEENPLLTSANLVSAVYYYRRHPNIEEFLNMILKDSKDYFMIQWIRTTWDKLSSMTEEEICDLVINNISIVANSEEG